MRCVYVLMYWSDEDGMVNVPTGERTPPKLKPYAVFEDSITAEKMKRNGDEIVKVPYFRNDFPDHLVITDDDLKSMPLNTTPHAILCDHMNADKWGKDSSTLAPPYNTYPRVTCSNKTVDEHSWTNRVD